LPFIKLIGGWKTHELTETQQELEESCSLNMLLIMWHKDNKREGSDRGQQWRVNRSRSTLSMPDTSDSAKQQLPLFFQ
jgi:hypothetical protein